MILLLVKTLRRNFALFEEKHLTFLPKFKICLIRQHVINHTEISRSEKNINLNEKNKSNSRKLQQRGLLQNLPQKFLPHAILNMTMEKQRFSLLLTETSVEFLLHLKRKISQ